MMVVNGINLKWYSLTRNLAGKVRAPFLSGGVVQECSQLNVFSLIILLISQLRRKGKVSGRIRKP